MMASTENKRENEREKKYFESKSSLVELFNLLFIFANNHSLSNMIGTMLYLFNLIIHVVMDGSVCVCPFEL